MTRCLTMLAVVSGMLAALPSPALPCSICNPNLRTQTTFRSELQQARLVVLGTLKNPRFDTAPGRPAGSGTTELHIATGGVLKPDSALGARTMIEIPQYLPILDPKNPPQLICFCNIVQGRIDPYYMKQMRSTQLLTYLRDLPALKNKERMEQLQFYFTHLGSVDEVVAADAFLEFAKSTDKEIGEVARHLPAAPLRQMLRDPATPSERISLYAFLLAASGNDADADFLRGLIERPDARVRNALDGVLSGYILMRPRAGWDMTLTIVMDRKRIFPERFAAARTLRFYQGWKPAETRSEVERILTAMLDDGEIADIAMEDLRQLGWWEVTPHVLAQYGKSTHTAPLTKRSIVRFALCSTHPQARTFVQQLRTQDRALVQEIEESLGR